MDQKIMIWDSEKQVFNEIAASEILRLLRVAPTPDSYLFQAWLPQIKSVFLHKRKRMEVVFMDGKTYNLPDMPSVYDQLFSVRHGA